MLAALPPSHLSWLLTHGVRAYVAMPPSALFPPAEASASEFAKCCSFYLWRLGIAAISKADAVLLFNAARLFAQAHAHERAWCATFHALRVVPPNFADEPTPEELEELIAAYGPLEETDDVPDDKTAEKPAVTRVPVVPTSYGNEPASPMGKVFDEVPGGVAASAPAPQTISSSLGPVAIADGTCGATKGDGEACTAKGQDRYGGRCGHHKFAEPAVRATGFSDVRAGAGLAKQTQAGSVI